MCNLVGVVNEPKLGVCVCVCLCDWPSESDSMRVCDIDKSRNA